MAASRFVLACLTVLCAVIVSPASATQCYDTYCPPSEFPDETACCTSGSLYYCCNISLAGWAIGVIVSGCVLTIGGIFLCCLCCTCCPIFQYRQATTSTTYVTTTAYQAVPQGTATSPPRYM